jgi:4-hydroxybenzoate polyprenyltransferase
VRFVRFLLKAARPGFWLTSVWFYLLPLGRHGEVFATTGFWLGLAYVTFPLGLFLYGWNDCVDAETDRLNPRKDSFLFGARGTAEQLAVLPRWIALTQLIFALAIAALLGWPRTLLFFAGLTLAAAIYNGPLGATKSRPVFDLLNQAGYLLVFVLSAWLNALPPLPWFTWVFGALFAMHSHLFGEVMDLEPDRRAGRRTTALVRGRIKAKWLLAALLAGESALVFFAARDAWVALFLAAGAGWFLLDVCWLWRDRAYSAGEARCFFLGWNAAALVSAPLVWKTAALAAH